MSRSTFSTVDSDSSGKSRISSDLDTGRAVRSRNCSRPSDFLCLPMADPMERSSSL